MSVPGQSLQVHPPQASQQVRNSLKADDRRNSKTVTLSRASFVVMLPRCPRPARRVLKHIPSESCWVNTSRSRECFPPVWDGTLTMLMRFRGGVSMRFGRVICTSAIATCVVFSALAQGLPKANKPEDVGFSSERLKRVTDAFQSEVAKGAIPGAVVLIARNGKIA
jgi:hypothetical protein